MNRLFSKIILFLLYCSVLLSCNNTIVEDPIYDIINDYIVFDLGKGINSKSLNLESNGNIKRLLLYDRDLHLQDMSFMTEFEVTGKNQNTLKIAIGITSGFLKLDKGHISIYKRILQDNGEYDYKLNYKTKLLCKFSKGKHYKIGFIKTNEDLTFIIKEDNRDIIKKKFLIDEDFLQYSMSGKPFFELEVGSLKIHNAYIKSNYKKNPKLYINGDSFVEGGALYQYGLRLNQRWCARVANDIMQDNCIIDGLGGDFVCEDWFNRFELICSLFQPQYAMICMGTNNYGRIEEYMIYMEKAIFF